MPRLYNSLVYISLVRYIYSKVVWLIVRVVWFSKGIYSG